MDSYCTSCLYFPQATIMISSCLQHLLESLARTTSYAIGVTEPCLFLKCLRDTGVCRSHRSGITKKPCLKLLYCNPEEDLPLLSACCRGYGKPFPLGNLSKALFDLVAVLSVLVDNNNNSPVISLPAAITTKSPRELPQEVLLPLMDDDPECGMGLENPRQQLQQSSLDGWLLDQNLEVHWPQSLWRDSDVT